jgi:DNA-binding NarL/FixJ family response regulator
MPVRVLLVDDHALFRDAMSALLAGHPDLEVVDSVANAPDAYGALERHEPDVVVMDINLPGVNGIAATREMLRRQPTRKILLLTAYSESEYVVQGLAAGARGYALKLQPGSQVMEAILDVARGRSYLCSHISRIVVDDHLRLRRGDPPVGGPCDALSQREKEIFDLLIRGFANDAIARQLCISVKTVETHRAHILKKLGVHSMVELVRFAARHNLLCE